MKFIVRDIREENGNILFTVEGQGMQQKHRKLFIRLFEELSEDLMDNRIDFDEALILMSILRKFSN